VPVVVAARDLAPGTTVTADDLVVAAVPEQARSSDSTADPAALVGRRVVVPLLAGDAVLARHLLTASLLAGYGVGTVATPLRLVDASALAVLRPGDLVDVIAASSVGAASAASDSASVVASRVRVLLAGTTAAGGGGGLLSAQSGDAPPSVVLATTSAQALEIARAAVGSRLSVVLRAE
jgi:Flp pilus assembly protein CpaB